MQQVKIFYLLPCYFFLLAGLLGCGSLSSPTLSLGIGITNIRDLKPERDNSATVYLQGKVTKQVPLLKWRVYQLQDSTGTIWVLTNQATPQLGDEVLLKGQARYQSIPLVGKEFGELYVEEQEHSKQTPASVKKL